VFVGIPSSECDDFSSFTLRVFTIAVAFRETPKLVRSLSIVRVDGYEELSSACSEAEKMYFLPIASAANATMGSVSNILLE